MFKSSLALMPILLCSCAVSHSRIEPNFALTAVADEPARVIPMNEVHAIVPVEPMQRVGQTFPAEVHRLNEEHGRSIVDSEALAMIRRTPGPAPNLYIVRGSDSIVSAVYITSEVIKGMRTVDEPARLNDTEATHWLVVHLGPGSGTPLMQLTEVSVQSGSIIARYERLNPPSATRDWQHYIYWVPLGDLDAGPYRLVLQNMDTQLAVVHRRVWVPEVKRE